MNGLNDKDRKYTNIKPILWSLSSKLYFDGEWYLIIFWNYVADILNCIESR